MGDDNYNPSHSLVEIYPNPTYDYLFISVQQTLQNIDMYAVNGEKVTANIEIKEVSSFDRRLNLSSLSPGTYFLALQIDNKIHTQQIVKNGVQIN
ncbi:MAG: T9SS type A sorting domain-containing protein [Flavobacteriaceae bacterium]